MNSTSVVNRSIQDHLKKSAVVSRRLQLLDGEKIANILNELAHLTLARSEEVLEANQKDLDRMDPNNPKYDRLLLNEDRLRGIANDLRKVAAMDSPLGKILQERTLDNGLQLQKVSVPLGVIGIVFESRPNVTFDVFALCFKSGNASVLKGSRDAHFSNLAILKLIHEVLSSYGLADACYLAPSDREALAPILEAVDEIDIIIPRGGQGLIQYVRANAKVPVIETGAGIVHAYFDKSGNATKGNAIITNAKARRVSVCNALDTLLIHEDRLSDLPILLDDLGTKHQCEIYADADAFAVLQGKYPMNLLHKAKAVDFGTEFLSMKLSVKTVASVDSAIDHVSVNSSKHSETVIAEDPIVITHYLNAIDAAVVYANASTAFTDGAQFGMGAEIGISTQKLHARGPMALEELTSYKWKVWGDGQVRK